MVDGMILLGNTLRRREALKHNLITHTPDEMDHAKLDKPILLLVFPDALEDLTTTAITVERLLMKMNCRRCSMTDQLLLPLTLHPSNSTELVFWIVETSTA